MITDRARILGIDAKLRARTRYTVRDLFLSLDNEPTPDSELILLDDRHCVASNREVYLVDLTPRGGRVVLASSSNRIEPTTRLLFLGGVFEDNWLLRYDPRIGRFVESLRFQTPDSFELLDPAMNQGSVARKVHYEESEVMITDIRAIDFAGDQPFHERRPYRRKTPASLMRTDAGIAGPLLDTMRHHTSPDRAHVAIVGASRITLRDRNGDVRWAVALPGVVDVAWGGSGDLVAFGSGMARIDTATGAVLDRQCGWDFGLWEHEPRSALGGRLCEAP